MAHSSHFCACARRDFGSWCFVSWLSQSAAMMHWRLCCSAQRSGLSGACRVATVAWRKDVEVWNKGGKRIGQRRRSSLHIGRQAERRKSALWKSRHRRIVENTGGRGWKRLLARNRGPYLPWQPSLGLFLVVVLMQLIPSAHCSFQRVCEQASHTQRMIQMLNLYLHISNLSCLSHSPAHTALYESANSHFQLFKIVSVISFKGWTLQFLANLT